MRLRKSIVKGVILFFFVSLVLASLPQSPFTIPKVYAQIGATYNQVLGGGIDADTIWWIGDSYHPEDLWQDDIASTNGKGLRPATKLGVITYTTNAAMSLSTAVTPADDYEIYLNVNVTAQSGGDGSVVFTFNGLDEYGNAISDALTLTGIGIYTTTIRFASVNTNGVVRSGFTSGESITCRIYQDRWGEVWKVRDGLTYQYKFDANLQVGDGTSLSSLSWTDTQIRLADSKALTVKNNAILTFESVDFRSGIASSTGIIIGEAGSNVTITKSSLITTSTSGDHIKLLGKKNTLWHDYINMRIAGYNYDVFDVIFSGATFFYPFFTASVGLNGTFDKISIISGSGYVIGDYYYRTTPVTLSNIYSETSGVYRYLSVVQGQTNDIIIINGDFPDWIFLFNQQFIAEVWRKYTFDLTTTYPNGTAIQNANVTLTYSGQGGGTVGSWLTFSNGSIPQQTLTMGFYNRTGGNTIYSYAPYTLTITSSYGNYTQDWIPTQKELRQIALTPTTEPTGITSMAPFFLLGMLIMIPIGLLIWKKH